MDVRVRSVGLEVDDLVRTPEGLGFYLGPARMHGKLGALVGGRPSYEVRLALSGMRAAPVEATVYPFELVERVRL